MDMQDSAINSIIPQNNLSNSGAEAPIDQPQEAEGSGDSESAMSKQKDGGSKSDEKTNKN